MEARPQQNLKQQPLFIFILSLLTPIFICGSLSCIAAAAIFFTLDNAFGGPKARATYAAAHATETTLTVAHGAEVRQAIQAFIDTNWSVATYLNPERLSAVATGHELTQLQSAMSALALDSSVSILKSNTIKGLEVADYSASQLEVFSCETLNFDEVTVDGNYVKSDEPLFGDRVYVMKRENNAWKVAAWYDFSDADHIRRDWVFVPQWEKDLIGDLPNLIETYDACLESASSGSSGTATANG